MANEEGDLMTCWRIAAETGQVEQVKGAPRGARDVFDAKEDQEELLNAAVGVAPEVIDVAGELPVRFIGGTGTQDMEFIDRISGLLTVVECKRTKAKAEDLAQLLGYSYRRAAFGVPNEQGLAFGVMPRETYGALLARATGNTAARKAAAGFLGVDMPSSMATRVGELDRALGREGSAARMGDRVGKRLWGRDWASMKKGGSVGSVALRRLPGAPQRLVLLAPDFHEECRRIAALLANRGVWIDLIAVSLLRSAGGGDLFVELKPSSERYDAYHHLWDCLRPLLVEERIAAHCRSRGLSVFSNRAPAWSFSAKSLPEVEIDLIGCRDASATISVRLDYGVLERKSERNAVNAVLGARLESVRGHHVDDGAHEWDFTLPGQRDRCVETFVEVARAIDAISEAPELQPLRESRRAATTLTRV